MFYRKRHFLPYAEKRSALRVRLPEADSLVVELTPESGEPVQGELIDLSMGGCCVRVPDEFDPGLDPLDVCEVLIAHPLDGWSVRTPGVVLRAAADGEDSVQWNFQFLNEGNLYSQLENAMARYFNRRRATRVTPELDAPVPVTLRWGRHRAHGRVHDLSTDGMGLVVDLVSGLQLEEGTAVDFSLDLPGERKSVESSGEVTRLGRLGERAFVGVRFRAEEATGLVAGADRITAYVNERQSSLDEWGDQFAA